MFNNDSGRERWLAAVNLGNETIPPHSLVRVAGCDENGAYKLEKPDGNDAATYWVTGPISIAANSTGYVTGDWPAFASYGNGNTPAAGEEWGPANGSWVITSGRRGFRVVGSAATTEKVVQIYRGNPKENEWITCDSNATNMGTIRTLSPTSLTWTDGATAKMALGNDGDSLVNGVRYFGCFAGYNGTGVPVYVVNGHSSANFTAVSNVVCANGSVVKTVTTWNVIGVGVKITIT